MKRYLAGLAYLVLAAALAAANPPRTVCRNGVCYVVPAAAPKVAAVPLPKITEGPAKVPVVAPPVINPGGRLPTGVLSEHLSPTERWSIAGRECDQRACYAAIGDGLSDDSKKLTLAVADPDARRRADVVAQLRRELGDSVKYWDGPPEDWSWRVGHKVDGPPPVIYCQAADGEVLFRQDGLQGGLAELVEGVRRTNPNYQPTKDPDPRKPAIGPLKLPDFLAGNNLPGVVVLALAGLVLVLLLRK